MVVSAFALVFSWFWQELFKGLDDFVSEIWIVLVFGSIFILAWITTIPSLIYNKKIPKKVEIDVEAKRAKLTYTKRSASAFMGKDSAFYLFEHNYYVVLVLMRKIYSSRGHVIYKEALSIIGFDLGFGWKSEDLEEIAESLVAAGFETKQIQDKDFFTRLTE